MRARTRTVRAYWCKYVYTSMCKLWFFCEITIQIEAELECKNVRELARAQAASSSNSPRQTRSLKWFVYATTWSRDTRGGEEEKKEEEIRKGSKNNENRKNIIVIFRNLSDFERHAIRQRRDVRPSVRPFVHSKPRSSAMRYLRPDDGTRHMSQRLKRQRFVLNDIYKDFYLSRTFPRTRERGGRMLTSLTMPLSSVFRSTENAESSIDFLYHFRVSFSQRLTKAADFFSTEI